MTNDAGMKKYIDFQQKLIDEDLIDTKTANWSDDWNRELNDAPSPPSPSAAGCRSTS